MTAESLEFTFDKFLVMNGRDPNAILCDREDARSQAVKLFCFSHEVEIYECISSYHDFPVTLGEPKFILI